MGAECHNLHILFFPFMAQGHMLPMVDMAKLFASRGLKATVLTTPCNAPLIQPAIDRHHDEQLHRCSQIQTLQLPFPSVAGLPQGCENYSSITNPTLVPLFFKALAMLKQPFDEILNELSPDCLVSDAFLPWTYDVAASHQIPRLVFHGTNFFYFCASHSVSKLEAAGSDDPSLVQLPGLPHRIEMYRSQLPDPSKRHPGLADVFNELKVSDPKSYGVVVNSFYELEPSYVECYRKVIARKAWHVGPVSLCNKSIADMSSRGDKHADNSKEACLKWLDGKRANSVIFVCFGSTSRLLPAQLENIRRGLEDSQHLFIWAVKGGDGVDEAGEGKGLILRGWAPQVMILNHKAVGGFVTHCGWNSSLEGISAGLPLVTWPMFADQFYNEKLIVDVLKVGVSVGVKVHSYNAEERDVVEAAEIAKAVNSLMGEGEEAEERRRRAKELGQMAVKAMEEGGSSYSDMSSLIQELTDRRAARDGGGGAAPAFRQS